MWKTAEGSTGRLIQLCFFYFFFYVITGITVKYFTTNLPGLPHVNQMEYLIYNTIGGTSLAFLVAVGLRWYRIKSNQLISLGKMQVPIELFYIIPSGICTAIIVPTTTIMYLLPIPVMVAMIIMRGSVIIACRIIDGIQIKQGILKKTVYIEEEIAVLFAVLAVGVDIFFCNDISSNFQFIHSPVALTVLGSYIIAYFIRLYIMNYFKNTRGKGVPQDNKGFYAIEQICACITMSTIGILLYKSFDHFSDSAALKLFHQALTIPTIHWPWEIVAGFAYGAVSFFAVFLFMFKGRTATFAGLVNRLTSLIAGTVATVVFWLVFNGEFPSAAEWISLVLILVAVGFLSKSEKKRTAELKAAKELPPTA